MARDFIKVDTTNVNATQANKLIEYRNLLRAAYAKGKEVLGIMNHNNDGSNWSDIETVFGLAIGKGNTVYDLVNGSVGAMEGSFQNSNGKDLTETLGEGKVV